MRHTLLYKDDKEYDRLKIINIPLIQVHLLVHVVLNIIQVLTLLPVFKSIYEHVPLPLQSLGHLLVNTCNRSNNNPNPNPNLSNIIIYK